MNKEYGRRGRAPCGHLGEHVFGGYVKCLEGCEGAVPHHVPPEKTQRICRRHGKSTYQLGSRVYCTECDDELI